MVNTLLGKSCFIDYKRESNSTRFIYVEYQAVLVVKLTRRVTTMYVN